MGKDKIMKTLNQGYALYAAARATPADPLAVRPVVGWVSEDDDGELWRPLIVFEAFAVALPEELVDYIGADLGEARKAAGLEPAPRRLAMHERADERGLVRPCGDLTEHPRHIYHAIACAGWPPQPAESHADGRTGA